MMKEHTEIKSDKNTDYRLKDWLKFIIPSVLGAIIFLMPIKSGGSYTIPFGILVDWVNGNYGNIVKYTLLVVTVLSALLTLIFSYAKPLDKKTFYGEVFNVTLPWVIFRLLGAIFCVLVTFAIGPQWITSEATGGTVVGLLMTNLLALFFFASIALPLLTDYGFMEFIGSFLSRPFRFLFKLPGRSAIDGLASWLGAAPIGVIMTTQQYDSGVYTKREAATVATVFSIVSIPFCYVIVKVVGLQDYFFQYYASVIFIGFICALILPRIIPLSLFSNEYNEVTGKQTEEDDFNDEPAKTRGVRLAIERSRKSPGFFGFLKNGSRNVINIWFGLVPATLAIAMISMILAEYTPIFQWLSAPFVPLLEWAGVAEARAAAPGLVIGFADMYLPALIGKDIVSEETRFLIAILSVSQLIYMSEVGSILLRSKMDIKFYHLVVIFIIRTIISAPLAIIIAKYIVFA